MTAPGSATEQVLKCETILAGLWTKNLAVPVASECNYFDLGGDSLRGAQLISWVQETFGIELSLLEVFESPTLSAQAHLIESRMAIQSHDEKPMAEYGFFGSARARLFGAVHRPGANRTGKGVVLCYPTGQEYMRIHRTYAELARSLVSAGYCVLRFDYFGCGDSEGEFIDATFERWVDDIHAAHDELCFAGGVNDIWLVGSRLGANLALEAAGGRPDLKGLVLWEPILDGQAYISTLKRAHEDLLRNNAVLDGYESRSLPHQCYAEYTGYPFSRKLFGQLSAIDLTARESRLPGIPALVVGNTEKPALRAFAASNGNGHAEFICAGESDAIWLKEDRQNKGLIPVRAVQNIVSWIQSRSK